EIQELLESLTRQTNKNFEMILVEDGSSKTSEKVYEDYSNRLTIQYYYKLIVDLVQAVILGLNEPGVNILLYSIVTALYPITILNLSRNF
ncbi:MAG: glycosyltransferase family 2 protein, partial [Flammeovirgaceae bacterium]|nr:glycosyltransferase family 2 protein [Flammeovirgaceae bacterium]